MEKLKAIDQVAYVRFASVYLQFQAVGDFEDAVNNVRENSRRPKFPARNTPRTPPSPSPCISGKPFPSSLPRPATWP